MKVRHTSPTKIEDISVAYPHPDQQKTFARICRACEQVQGIYRESLSELESLFSALSQKAFKGELDLSRVHLPAIAEVNAEIETKGLPEASTDGSIFELPTPANLNELADVKGRNVVVNQWIDAYLQQLGKQSFSTEAFIRLVQQKLSDLQSADDEADIDYEFSAADYDHVKDWIFKNMKSNRLKQDYDDANNRVKISLVKD